MKHCKFKKSNVHSRGRCSWSNFSRKILFKNQKMKHIRQKRRNVRFSWSNLPGKIILKISKKLESRDNILRFQQVCSKWRKRSLTPPTNLLSLNLPLPQTIKDNSKLFPFHNSESPLVLRVSNIYLITPSKDNVNDQSLKPWMIMAEELNPGKIKVRHPLTAEKVKNFPPFLDMSRFKALKLAQGYNFKSSNNVHKVLLCSNSASCVQVLVLYYKGALGKLSLEVLGSRSMSNNDDEEEEEEDDNDEELYYSWENFKVSHCGAYWFMYLDDVTRFKDMNCGVDRKGRLFVLDTESMSMSNSVLMVSNPVCMGDIPTNRRKRLVVDPASGELHLVVRENVRGAKKVRFKVYKLNEQGKRWDSVENIGRKRVLFVGIDHCFFAMARHFSGCDGNSIIFASHCFTQYTGSNAPDNSLFDDEGTEVGVYRMGEGDNFRLLSSASPEFAGLIWPPPTWFCTRECKEETAEDDATHQSAEGLLSGSSSGETECNDDKDNDVEMLTDSSDRDEEMESHTDAQEQTSSEEHSGAQGQMSERKSDAQERKTKKHSDARELSVKETKSRVTRDDQIPEHDFTEKKVFDSNRTPVTPSFSTAPEKSSTVKFQEVDIRSELLPTLQTIWAQHGNLFTKDTICSKKMLGCVMEELAELIITLKNTTGRTLTDSKANELSSTLSDIKRAGLKVDWLEPVIEKAIAIQKSKPFIESIAAVDREKAKIEQEEREFLSQTAKAKQELDENRACLSTRIPFPVDQSIDLDDYLGDGL